MWKQIIIGMAALTAALTVSGAALPEQVQAAYSSQAEYTGSNVNEQNYSIWGDVVNSALVETEDGQLMRFQADALEDSYLVEYYSSSYHLEKTVKVAKELSLFGAFYDDGTNYYVLSGQKNLEESDTVEVYRLTKYDHQWNRISSAGLYGANTYIPFYAGSARIASDGNLLFVRTCHEMYKSSDGLHHQANVTIEFHTEDMTVVDSYTIVSNISCGYVSHSFNQFIRLDGGKIVGVDHGDTYPRSVVLAKYTGDYSSSGFEKRCSPITMFGISGTAGNNATGVSVGGFEISSGNYLVAGNAVSMGEDYSASGTRNIFVSSVDRDLSETPVVHTITSYAEGETSPSTPQFVRISEDSFLLMWMKDGVLNYCKINESGEKIGEIYTMEGELSDCVPIVTGGKLVWYTWKNEADTFYEIDLTDLSKTNTYPRTNGHIVVTDEEVTDNGTENGKSLKISCTGCGEVYLLQAWLIDGNGKLTVSGTGDIARTSGKPEWYSYREKIKTAEIKGTGMTDASYLFDGCSNLTSVDVSGLDTGKVTNMESMFRGCSSLTEVNFGRIDTGSVTDMESMFRDCSSLKKLDISGLDTGNVTNMSSMFYGCNSLTTLDVSGLDTGNVTNMSSMFHSCNSLTTLDVSGLDTGNVKNMTSMFYGCNSLTTLDVSGLDTGKVTNMGLMFENCSSLTDLNLGKIDTGSVTDMGFMFYGCSSLTTLDISGFDTSSVQYMGGMFENCSSLTKLNVNGLDTGNVISMVQMFENCSSLTTLDVSGFHTSNVITMLGMFENCSSLTTLDLSGFDTGNVKFMSGMLDNCSSLTTIYSPKNVNCDAALPTGKNESWHLSDGTVVTALLQNLSYSVPMEKKTTPTEDESTSNTQDKEDTGSTDTGTTNPDTGTTDTTTPGTGSTDTGTTAPGTGTTDTITQTGNIGDTAESTTNATTRITTKNTTIKLSRDTYTYDGKAQKPTVTVYDSKGKKISSKYYTVTYKNNTKVGKATVTIKFKDKYTGTIKKTYKINPKATTLKKVTSSKKKSVTVTWKKQAAQTTGYEIQYATNSKFTKNKKTVTVKGTKTTSRTITKLSGRTRYYIRIRTYKTVDGKKYYSEWCREKVYRLED